MGANKWIWIIVLLIIVIGLGIYFFSSEEVSAPSDTEESGEMMDDSTGSMDDMSDTEDGNMMDGEDMMDNEMGNEMSDGSMEMGNQEPVIVEYTDEGFVPATLTLKAGQTVQFVNTSSRNMWVASAIHPTHTVYSGTSLQEHCPDTSGTAFDQCGTGDTYTFTFTEAGTWGYHNHVGASDTGQIIVTEN